MYRRATLVRRATLLLLSLVLAITLMSAMSGPAQAQGYTGWIEHSYPSAGLWYCDWYGSEYWCQGNGGVWFPSNPDWYNASSAEMMRVFGEPVL